MYGNYEIEEGEATEHALDKLTNGCPYPCKSLVMNSYDLRDGGVIKICEAAKYHPTLESIAFFDNHFWRPGAYAIAELIKVNTTLESVSLISCQIDSETGSAIADSLLINRSIKYLNLSGGNSLRDEGIIKMTQALKVNCMLTQVHLGGTFFTDVGASAIAKIIEMNTPLTVLYLDNIYEVTHKGWSEIASALKCNVNLIEMDFSCNKFTDETAKVFAEVFDTNCFLQILFFRYNKITDEGANEFLNSIIRNKRFLLKFELIGNNISPEILSNIDKAIADNSSSGDK